MPERFTSNWVISIGDTNDSYRVTMFECLFHKKNHKLGKDIPRLIEVPLVL